MAEEETKVEETSFEEATQEKEELTSDQQKKKMKNLISLVILLGGLFVGSLFVDVIQMVRGGGFSQRALNNTDIFQLNGKTWVSYADPIVKVQIVNDDTCETCKPDEALLGMRRILPTMLTEKVDYTSPQGKALLEKFKIKTIPAFIFSKEVEQTELFAQAQQIFDKQDDLYSLRTADLGLPVGKYIEPPKVNDNDVKIGAQDSKVKVVEFSDFQCPYCKQLHQTVISKLLADYGDKIQFTFKFLPLSIHPQANNAALAAACANEQGKFAQYSDKLFATQDAWGKLKDATPVFKTYASQLGLNAQQFNSCLSTQKYKDLIVQDTKDGQNMGLSGTPGTFVNEQFFNGLVSYDDMKKAIDEQLDK